MAEKNLWSSLKHQCELEITHNLCSTHCVISAWIFPTLFDEQTVF